MKPVNEMKLVIPSRSANESYARVAVAAFAAQLDPTIEEINDIKTAVSEAVTNCIVHAYRDKIGTIFLTVKLFEEGKISIKSGIPAAASKMSSRRWSLSSPPPVKNGRAWALRSWSPLWTS